MTADAMNAWDDTVLPFQLDRADTRGRIARLDGTLDAILTQHDYPGPVAALVAEAALLTALIGQTIKLRWKLSLQVRGDGPIHLIATDYFAPGEEGGAGHVRAYAGFDAQALAAHDGAPFEALGAGLFAILIDQGEGSVPYQGITPLAGGSLAACAETYFAQSEQLPTRFALGAAQASAPGEDMAWRGGGIMVQHMPKASPFAQGEATGEGGLLSPDDLLTGDEAEDWNRVTLHLGTVELTELVGPHVNPDGLLVRLFHEESPRVFDVQRVRFGCTCAPEKVVQSLSVYSAQDIAGMTTDEGKVTADCQFCGAHYEFAPDELGYEARDAG